MVLSFLLYFDKLVVALWFSLRKWSLWSAHIVRLWALSSHCDGGLRSQFTLPEAVKAARMTCMGRILVHIRKSNFHPVLNFKHMSNPTCFTEITHSLKIKPCSAAVLDWDQKALSILQQAHSFIFKKDFSPILPWQNARVRVELKVCSLFPSEPSYLCFSSPQVFGAYVTFQIKPMFFQAKSRACYLVSGLKRVLGQVEGWRQLYWWFYSENIWVTLGM